MVDHRIVQIDLDERSITRRSPDIDHERKVAIFDLLEENYFAPVGLDSGPYHLVLGLEESRLRMDIAPVGVDDWLTIQLPLMPLRKIIREYFMVCESYFQAIRSASPSQIEAIDMGRRGLHDEGARMLQARLKDKVETDYNTARRLFTLVCILNLRGRP